ITAGKNSSDEVSHLVQVGVGKAHQEVIYNIRSRAGGGQHHFRSLPQITQHDGALRADDLGPDVVSVTSLHVVFHRPECATRKLQVYQGRINVIELRKFRAYEHGPVSMQLRNFVVHHPAAQVELVDGRILEEHAVDAALHIT